LDVNSLRPQTNLYLPTQQVLLNQLAEDRGLSVSEIIRQSIDRYVDKPMPEPAPGSRDSWDEAVAFMRSMADRWGKG
jgi:hypothetical protein